MTSVQVSDIMSRKPISVMAEESIFVAAAKMKRYRISSLIVRGKDYKLQGIVTVDDIVRQAVATRLDLDTPIEEVMTEDVVTVEPNRDIRDVMDLFSEYEIRQAPVMEEETIVGYVTLKDLLRFEPALLDIAVETLRQEEQSRQETIKRVMDNTEMDDQDLF